MESPKLTELIGKISREYTNTIDLPYKGHPLANYIRKEAPELIRKAMPQIYRDYRIEGSAGRGRWAETAWIRIEVSFLTRATSLEEQRGLSAKQWGIRRRL